VYETTVDATSAGGGADRRPVVDLYTAYYAMAPRSPMRRGRRVAAPAAEPDEFGLLFEEGNPLRECVNAAAELRADGTLVALEDEWLVAAGGVTVISE
jgi:polar amino acid transport system substrate-binding protein